MIAVYVGTDALRGFHARVAGAAVAWDGTDPVRPVRRWGTYGSYALSGYNRSARPRRVLSASAAGADPIRYKFRAV